jgi:hypothetical protein
MSAERNTTTGALSQNVYSYIKVLKLQMKGEISEDLGKIIYEYLQL